MKRQGRTPVAPTAGAPIEDLRQSLDIKIPTKSGIASSAERLYALGYLPLPVRGDGSKAPTVAWHSYQQERPEWPTVSRWFRDTGTDGVGVITGKASEHLEMLEFEGRAVAEGLFKNFADLMTETGAGDLWNQINGGWSERTPSGGVHLHYRISDGPARRNTKLAMRLSTETELAENPKEKFKVLIETRGEGGFTIVAPSAGRTHPTGRPWQPIKGGPDTIPTITTSERGLLYTTATLLDQRPVPEPEPARAPALRTAGELLPGNDFNARAPWADILEPHGWRAVDSHGFVGWTRPGKTTPGISATTGRNDADNLYVFSSSTEFEPETPYSKFAAYTLLNHGGDYSAAARALRKLGYGGDRAAARIVPPPRRLTAVLALPADSVADPSGGAPVDAGDYGQTEDGMARLLERVAGAELRFCLEKHEWLAWTGQRWAAGFPAASQRALAIARELPDDAGWRPFRRRCLSANGVRGILSLAATQPGLIANIADFDAHPWELNTPGGIVDLHTGELLPADPSRLHTRSTICTPDYTADNRVWLDFLDTTYGGDQDKIDWLQTMVGMSLAGEVTEHIVPFFYGTGRNGKGTFLDTIAKILGSYAVIIPISMLLVQRFPAHPTEIAQLAGARFALGGEVNADAQFDEARFKMLSGGDRLTGRFLSKDFFSFDPTHQLWLVGNHLPAVTHGGPAFWARTARVDHPHAMPEHLQNKKLRQEMPDLHGPAVLAWAITGAVRYGTEGIVQPETVVAATAAYQHDQDSVAQFVDEECTVGGGALVRVAISLFRDRYKRWCDLNDLTPVNAKRLGMELYSRHSVQKGLEDRQRSYANIRLNDMPHGYIPGPLDGPGE